MSNKPSESGPPSEREFTIVLEDLRSQFHVFGEGLISLQDKVERIEEKVSEIDGIKEDISIIKLVIPTLATKKELEQFATKKDLEQFATKKDLEQFATKKDLEQFQTAIKKDFEKVATKEDLRLMEKRLTALEHSR